MDQNIQIQILRSMSIDWFISKAYHEYMKEQVKSYKLNNK